MKVINYLLKKYFNLVCVDIFMLKLYSHWYIRYPLFNDRISRYSLSKDGINKDRNKGFLNDYNAMSLLQRNKKIIVTSCSCQKVAIALSLKHMSILGNFLSMKAIFQRNSRNCPANLLTSKLTTCSMFIGA